mmetsp:Transcript_5477/g.9751  ORF Transcript_5477/g.9751 Transcript_5477/m.9751 type:complete len:124 (+) Transcript_5477:127-498(+)
MGGLGLWNPGESIKNTLIQTQNRKDSFPHPKSKMSFIEIATKQGEDAVTRIDGQGQVINNILGSVGEISAESLTKVYREGLGSKGEKNEKVSGLVVATMDAVEGTVSLLKQIQTWVVLMIPPV